MKTIWQIIGGIFLGCAAMVTLSATATHNAATGGTDPVPPAELTPEQAEAMNALQDVFPDVISLQSLRRAITGTVTRDRAGLTPKQIEAMDTMRDVFPDVRSLRALGRAIEGTVEREQAINRVTPAQREAVENLSAKFSTPDALESLGAAVDEITRTRAVGAVQEDDSLPSFGAPAGPTVVEFADYQCGFCKRMLAVLLDSGVHVRVVEYPVLGEMSRTAAKWALAARKQDSYAAFHIALMQRQGRLSEEGLEEVATSLKLDIPKLRADSESPEVEEELQKNFNYGRMLEVRGTPFMIVGDMPVPGAISGDRLAELLQEQSGEAAHDGHAEPEEPAN